MSMRQFNITSIFLLTAVAALILGWIGREYWFAERQRVLNQLAEAAEQHLKPRFTDAVLRINAKQLGVESEHLMWPTPNEWPRKLAAVSHSFGSQTDSATCKIDCRYLSATKNGDIYIVKVFLSSWDEPDFTHICTYMGKSTTIHNDDKVTVMLEPRDTNAANKE